jgi:single-stranded DNA-binding protein
MNSVELIGHLVFPVEAQHEYGTGRPVARAMLAVSHGTDALDFVPVTLRGLEAADAAKYLGDGSVLAVRGHLHSALVLDRDMYGARRRHRHLYVIVDRITYLTVRPPRGGERQ